jgi:DNA polymerase I-like protein with 3'-5' exonuclease and polymerase domains
MNMEVKTVLLDARTPVDMMEAAKLDFASADVLGLDCETQQRNRHEGLDHIRKLIFDHRRTVMTGFSWYRQGSDTAYYVNLNHADVENRLPETFVTDLFSLRKPDSIIISHNAPYEITMFQQCYGIELTDVICSMQLAVTHHGPDNYDITRFNRTPLTAIRPLVGSILEEFADYDPERDGRNLNPDQSFVYSQFGGKQTDASHSYNGFVKSLAYGYGLKDLVQTIFNVRMKSYKETLDGEEDMASLTGSQVQQYGAEDAYWCVQVYQWLYDDLLKNNPAALVTFFEQENPMIHVYADAWMNGLRLNTEAVYARQDYERTNTANLLKDIKATLREMLPFPAEPNENMVKYQGDWYLGKSNDFYTRKRRQIEEWAKSPDSDDVRVMVTQVSNPIGNAWANLKGAGRLNLTYWQTIRVILYDLMGHKPVRVGGKIASDAEARGRILQTYEQEGNQLYVRFLNLISKLASVEQAMKLYITPYTHLVDPETNRVYPTINSMLATRRMAMQNPNGMQLAKRNKEINYVRSYFLPDNSDHVVLSADWSSIELVLIGEYSGDPAFAEVFGQIPYGDLHSGAAADCLAVATLPGLSESEFLAFKRGENPNERRLARDDGVILSPSDFAKWARTEIGKGANFNYWYSGALGTVGERLGWSTEQMWNAVERYRDRFSVAEEWRVKRIEEARQKGFITLPDGHRRERYECTQDWANNMRRKFGSISAQPAMRNFGDFFIKRMQTRAGNQIVNTDIQGSCAGMAKRAILAVERDANRRFMMPIHDELVFSVHKDYVLDFIPILKKAMNTQPVFVRNLPLHCTVSLGRTFGVEDQIELDEAPFIEGVIPAEYKGKVLPDNIIADVVRYATE